MILFGLRSLAFANPEPIDKANVEEFTYHQETEERQRVKRRGSQKAVEEPQTMHGLLLGVGTLGLTGGYVYAPNSKISFTGQYSHMKLPESEKEIESNTYLENTTLSTISLRGNLHPLPNANWFHVSAGLAYSLSTIDLSIPKGSQTIEEIQETSNSRSGAVDFSDVQLYLGTGVGYTNKKGIGFFFDVGCNYQGTPQANMAYESSITQTAIETEENSIIEHYSQYQFYPVVQLGMTYLF